MWLFGETENRRPGAHKVAHHFCRSLLSCQNPLNCHMGSTNLVFHESQIFKFLPRFAISQSRTSTGLLLVNLGFWNFRFPDFRFSRFFFWEILLEIMLVRYRGINNKGVLERPWTIWRVLEAISTTLKCQFTGENVEKWTFWPHVQPNRLKLCK